MEKLFPDGIWNDACTIRSVKIGMYYVPVATKQEDGTFALTDAGREVSGATAPAPKQPTQKPASPSKKVASSAGLG